MLPETQMNVGLPPLESVIILAQAAAAPEIDAAFVARVVSRMIHILCAIILGGGLFYMRSVLSPAGVDACFADRRTVWARWVAAASFLLLVSGLFNFLVIWQEYKSTGEKLPPTYHALFGIKVLLGLLVMFIAAILAGKTPTADRFRANIERWLKIAWTAVIAIVVIGALLRSHHIRRPPNAEPAAPANAEAVDGQES
jgi:putative copper export protein